eukprot:7293699-Alexandrium_andersonii.AAC.1
MDVAAYDYNQMQEFDLVECARKMVDVNIVRRRDGSHRALPHEYVAIDCQPQYARGQIIMLRRANCK